MLLQEVFMHGSEDFVAHRVAVRWNIAEILEQFLHVGNWGIAMAHIECRDE